MKLLETKEQLTLNELLRIAYEYGNDNAIQPEDEHSLIDEEFSEWIKGSEHLFKKLIIPRVSVSLPSDKELQKVVERIAYEQHGENQAEDCYAKMGILHEFVKLYVDGGNER